MVICYLRIRLSSIAENAKTGKTIHAVLVFTVFVYDFVQKRPKFYAKCDGSLESI